MRLIILLFLYSFSLVECLAQNRELLPGKWEYEAIRKADQSEPVSQSILRIVVGNNSYFEFSKNNQYIAHENNSFEFGEWTVGQNNTTLTLKAQGGAVRQFEIISLTRNTLVLLVKGNAYHTLTRRRESHDINTGLLHSTEEINKHLLRKWVLVELTDSLQSPEINQWTSDIAKGGWYEFRHGGHYSRKVMTDEKKGQWKLKNTNRTIVMVDDDGFGSVWDICYISKGRLILQKAGTSVRQVFTALQ